MCHKCIRKGRGHLVRTGLLNVLVHQARKGDGIPLFWDKASNYYIEGKLYFGLKNKTDKKIYKRKGRRLDVSRSED